MTQNDDHEEVEKAGGESWVAAVCGLGGNCVQGDGDAPPLTLGRDFIN